MTFIYVISYGSICIALHPNELTFSLWDTHNFMNMHPQPLCCVVLYIVPCLSRTHSFYPCVVPHARSFSCNLSYFCFTSTFFLSLCRIFAVAMQVYSDYLFRWPLWWFVFIFYEYGWVLKLAHSFLLILRFFFRVHEMCSICLFIELNLIVFFIRIEELMSMRICVCALLY